MQELHQIAQGLLSNLLRNLCSHQVDDAFAARAPTIDSAEPGGVAIEAWLPERYGSLDPAVHPPAWREPSTEQVCAPSLILCGSHLPTDCLTLLSRAHH